MTPADLVYHRSSSAFWCPAQLICTRPFGHQSTPVSQVHFRLQEQFPIPTVLTRFWIPGQDYWVQIMLFGYSSQTCLFHWIGGAVVNDCASFSMMLVSNEFSAAVLVRWRRGLLASRVGESSHPGPLTFWEQPCKKHIPSCPGQLCPGCCFQQFQLRSSAGHCFAPLPDPVRGSALRRPAPADSTRLPIPMRHASSPSRLYCPVLNCPDHCHISSRGWSSFSAMKGHLDRHLGRYLDGDLPAGWLQGGLRSV